MRPDRSRFWGRGLWLHLAARASNLCRWVCPGNVSVTYRRRQTGSFTESAVMGKAGGRDDFEWVYNDQPHTSRRKEILGKETQQVSF